jgi:Uma2 family endonuclease
MPAALALAEQRVVLHNVSWETYERPLAESIESPGTRFTYDGGALEIMTLSVEHENPNRTLAALVEIVAEETGKDLVRAGSTTFKRQDLLKGFEPDSSYYIEHTPQVLGKRELDLTIDPPPDLVIEVDITRSSLNRFPVFAAMGVPEVWRFDGERVAFHVLGGVSYEETGVSAALPPLTAATATTLLEASSRMGSRVWVRRVRESVRA